jgi:hypothetical protein
MREIRSYGSVRGVAGDRYPYRDFSFHESMPGAPSPRTRVRGCLPPKGR